MKIEKILRLFPETTASQWHQVGEDGWAHQDAEFDCGAIVEPRPDGNLTATG